jgi:hypothetical protein
MLLKENILRCHSYYAELATYPSPRYDRESVCVCERERERVSE